MGLFPLSVHAHLTRGRRSSSPEDLEGRALGAGLIEALVEFITVAGALSRKGLPEKMVRLEDSKIPVDDRDIARNMIEQEPVFLFQPDTVRDVPGGLHHVGDLATRVLERRNLDKVMAAGSFRACDLLLSGPCSSVLEGLDRRAMGTPCLPVFPEPIAFFALPLAVGLPERLIGVYDREGAVHHSDAQGELTQQSIADPGSFFHRLSRDNRSEVSRKAYNP
jgi:hypothetical protein